MAKKMKKVLSCLVVIVILMSTMPVISSNSASGTFEILRVPYEVGPEHIYLDCGEYENYFDICVKFYWEGSPIETVGIDAATGESYESVWPNPSDVFILDATHGKITLDFVDIDFGGSINSKISYKFSYIIEESDVADEKKPDLIIKDISWSPSNPDEGDTIKFTVKIKNQGSGSAGSSKVKYYIDGSYVCSDSVSKLSAGSTSTETFTWTADNCGDVKVKAVADANTDVTETSENNNDRTETVSIKCPTLKPDLIIKDISWSPSSPDEGDTIKFTVKIKNQGSGSAESSKVKYYIDGSYEDYDSVSKLSAGSTSTEIFRWTADKCGDIKVKAVADANYVVTETSENNNDRTETVSINCLPSDIVIEDINWDPYNLVAGEPVDIAIIVRNNGKGKYVCPGNTRVDIKAIDKNNLIYGSAINEWVSTRWDIGDLEVGKRNTLIFKDFIFNIPYLAESLRVELISAGDGDVSNNFLEESIPQVRHNDDDFYKCMIDGVLICLTSGVKTTAALKKAGKVVDAIKQTFSSAQYYEELVEDLRQGQYEVFFSKIAKNKAEVIAQGDWGSGLIGAIKAKAAKAYEFFDVFKNIVETGIACANVFEFYVDILEGWIRGGEDGGISSSGVVGASLIYILVEDEYGKEAGYDQSGTKKEEIDGSLVFTCDHFKTVLIPGKFDNTKITVFGYDRDVEPGKTISLASEGETDSSFTLSIVESSKTIIYEDVPVNPQTIGTIEINEYNPEYYLDLDYDGDGTTDDSAKPDSIETFYEAEEVIFAEDFDTYATGSFPSSGSWNLKYNGRGDSYQIVDNSQSVSPPNSLKLEGEANWAATGDHPLAETPDQVIYEVDVKVTQPGSSLMNYPDAAMGLANPNIGTWGTRYAGVIFGNAENRVIQPGNIPFNFDQWYHIKVEADMNNRVYDVWLDDQLIASDISTSSNGDYTDIRLEGGNNAHTRVWFDNVYVYRGHYPFQDPNGGLNGVPDENTITNTIGMEFVPIPAGEFEMGSPSDEQGRWSDEGPVHHVNIENAFHMGRYEVTQKQWREIMGDNPSHFKGDDLPVERVSWNDVQEFIRKLNEKEGTNKYRLPSEAEWEYACRAGTTTRYSFGDFESKLGDYAWYGDNSGDKTHPVGQKKPNSWGLYDMHGNVREWVQDSWHDDYNGAPADGSAWEGDGAGRAFHGGCWFSSAWNSRSAIRNHSGPRLRGDFLGFRLLKSL